MVEVSVVINPKVGQLRQVELDPSQLIKNMYLQLFFSVTLKNSAFQIQRQMEPSAWTPGADHLTAPECMLCLSGQDPPCHLQQRTLPTRPH